MTETSALISPVIRVWAPDPAVNPAHYKAMLKLIELKGKKGETLESILQHNSITEADITPPYKISDDAPDIEGEYVLYASPETLTPIVCNAVYDAVRAATGLAGEIKYPFHSDYRFDLHMQKYGLTMIYGNPAPLQDVL